MTRVPPFSVSSNWITVHSSFHASEKGSPAGLAAATGGLLAPMAVHAVVDVTTGRVARRAFRATPLDEVPGGEPAGEKP